jgi:Na+/glutamate symporter
MGIQLVLNGFCFGVLLGSMFAGSLQSNRSMDPVTSDTSCHVFTVLTTARKSNMIQTTNFWHQNVTCIWGVCVCVCVCVHMTKIMVYSLDDWIY